MPDEEIRSSLANEFYRQFRASMRRHGCYKDMSPQQHIERDFRLLRGKVIAATEELPSIKGDTAQRVIDAINDLERVTKVEALLDEQ